MKNPSKAKLALLLAPVIAILIFVLPLSVHAAEVYSLSALPAYSQEGATITMVLSVAQATPSTTYEFTFTVTDPANNVFTSNTMAHATGPTETSFMVITSYPGPDFPGGSSTSLVGTYHVAASQGKPIALPNVATASFVIGITDKTQYQRTQTVSIIATGYSPGTTASVMVKTSVTSRVVYSHSVTVPANGQITDSWQIPKNATTTESYIASVTGTTVKTPRDSETFSIGPAPVTISSLSSSKSVYQRTETFAFSFQPIYPNGQTATTGLGIIRLTSPTNTILTLTASYNSTAQLFVALYKTSSTNQTGIWTASLASNGYDDGFGNTGPSGTLTTSAQLQQATFSISVTIKNYFLANEPIKFNATITYPSGANLQAGNVTSTLAFGAGGYTTRVPTVYDTTLNLWVGTYTPKGNEPGGLWSLNITAFDTAAPANSGSMTRAIQLQDRPPIAMIAGSGTTALTSVSLTFNSTGSFDPDGTIVAYSWNYGDGSTGSGFTTSHSFTTAGTYTVTLTVTDNSGSTASASLAVVIQDRPPIAKLSSSTSSTITGSTISFDGGTSTDPDGSITTYRWDFGDGTSGTGVTTGHAYASSGNYTVRLTITDNSGLTGSTSSSVLVKAAPLTNNSTFYFAILAPIIAAVLGFTLLYLKRHKVTHANLKIDLEAVKSEAGKIENQEFFKSVREQLDKDKET
jgi:PKD repeat protein